MRFGIHAAPQDCTLDELKRLWRFADDRGFHWCSVWDHLYSISDLANPASPAFEGVATVAALAASTTRVRVGCVVSASATAIPASSVKPRSRSIT
jgi:alkanesulfonate monooxygenase SsuD/methylene tetrahydromethanopterin reductase-like flavin-dependent oxidoreductase (luciferase family)